jgi:hypothetical protein
MLAKSNALAGAVALAMVIGGAGAITYAGSDASASAVTRAHRSVALPTIDANTDPSAAGDGLNQYCQDQMDCKFVGTPSQTVALDSQRAIGDKLYNCNDPTVKGLGDDGVNAEDEVTLSDERGESTDTEVTISATAKAAIVLGAEVWSKQYEGVSTTTTKTATVPVIAGYEGWINTQVPTLTLSGTITDGIHLQVTNFRLALPGYGEGALLALVDTAYSQPLDDPSLMPPRSDRSAVCDHLPAIVVPPGAIRLPRPAPAPTISVCVSGHRKCNSRAIAGSGGLGLRSGDRVALARGSRIYATGTDRHGKVVLRAPKPLRAGGYSMLVISSTRSTMSSITVR